MVHPPYPNQLMDPLELTIKLIQAHRAELEFQPIESTHQFSTGCSGLLLLLDANMFNYTAGVDGGVIETTSGDSGPSMANVGVVIWLGPSDAGWVISVNRVTVPGSSPMSGTAKGMRTCFLLNVSSCHHSSGVLKLSHGMPCIVARVQS